MKRADHKAVKPRKQEDLNQQTSHIGALDLSFERIDERAFAKTEVLVAILGREERSSWQHWGLNE